VATTVKGREAVRRHRARLEAKRLETTGKPKTRRLIKTSPTGSAAPSPARLAPPSPFQPSRSGPAEPLLEGDLFFSAFQTASTNLDPKPNPYVDDPVGWAKDVLGLHLWSLQQQIAESVRDNRYTAVPSCHDSGKSFLAAVLVAWWISVHPFGDAFCVTTAPTTAQVEAILWREISRMHKRGNLEGRLTLDAKWRLNDQPDGLVAYGRKPQDYDADAFQGIHQKHLLVVLDEANGIPKVLWDGVDSIATNEGARVLAIGNPDNPASHFATVCKPGSGFKVIRIDGLKTPNFTKEWVPEEVRPLLLSPTWVKERKKRWGMKSPLYISKVRGRFPDVSDEALISPNLIEAAQNRNLRPDGWPQYGIDVARFGDDETVIMRNHGGHLRCVYHSYMNRTTKTAGVIMRLLREENYNATAVVDGIGVGSGVVDILHDADMPVVDFIGGQAALDNEKFANSRAEGYWQLRQLFVDGEIDIDPDDDQLASELGSIQWTTDAKGRIVVERKEDYKKRMHASSPDRADAAMYAVCFPSEITVDVASHKKGGGMLNRDLLTRPL
jgi:hypothetical protein